MTSYLLCIPLTLTDSTVRNAINIKRWVAFNLFVQKPSDVVHRNVTALLAVSL